MDKNNAFLELCKAFEEFNAEMRMKRNILIAIKYAVIFTVIAIVSVIIYLLTK